MAEPVTQIVYWKGLLGRGELIRQVALLAEKPIELVDITGEEKAKYAEGVNFFNLPLLIKGDVRLSETDAIIQALIFHSSKPELLGKNAKDQVEVTMLKGVIADLSMGIMMPCTREDYETAVPAALNGIGVKKLTALATHLGERTTLVGDYYTIADVSLNFALELIMGVDAKLGVKAFDYSKFEKYIAAYRSIPAIKAHLESEDRKSRAMLSSAFSKLIL